jgi:hypothetical protein
MIAFSSSRKEKTFAATVYAALVGNAKCLGYRLASRSSLVGVNRESSRALPPLIAKPVGTARSQILHRQ